MSISPVTTPVTPIPTAGPKNPQTATAPDGDSVAVEKSETTAKQQAEKANGGFAPSSTSGSQGSSTTSGINKLA
jgi:hypothetical protein